jgi:PKD repeat protein
MVTITFGTSGNYPSFFGDSPSYGLNGASSKVPGMMYGDVAGPMLDDYTLQIVGNCTEPTPYAYTLNPTTLNGHTLLITDSVYHNGDPTAGHIWDLNTNHSRIQIGTNANNGTIIFQGLNIRGDLSNFFLGINQLGVNLKVIVDDCIIIGNTDLYFFCFTTPGSGIQLQVTRNKIYSSLGYSLYATDFPVAQSATYENNDFIGKNFYAPTVGGTFRNNYISAYDASSFSTCLGNNNKSTCAMSDANWLSGSSGNSGSVISNNQFASLAPTDSNWLFLKAGNVLYNTGTTPTLISTDIVGLPIPNTQGGYYTVGAHSFIPFYADFTADSIVGYANLTVHFTDNTIGSPTSWAWNFGDGSPYSYLQNPIHKYTSSGSFTVTLSASTSAFSDVMIKTNYITVNIQSDLKTDYITLGGPVQVARYGTNKLINLTNFLPQYIKATDTLSYVQVFETFLNNMFPGESGYSISATDIIMNKSTINTSASTELNILTNQNFQINDRDFTYIL